MRYPQLPKDLKPQLWSEVSSIKTYSDQGLMVRWVELRLPVGAAKESKPKTCSNEMTTNEAGYASPSEDVPTSAAIASQETSSHPRSSAIKACARFNREVSWSSEASSTPEKWTARPQRATKPDLTSPLAEAQRKLGGFSHLQAISRAMDLAEDLDSDEDTWHHKWTPKAGETRFILQKTNAPCSRTKGLLRPATMCPTGDVTLRHAEKPFHRR